MNKVPVLFCLLFFGCATKSFNPTEFRNMQWGALYSEKEKIQFTIEKADLNFHRGKQLVNDSLLQQAKQEYNFLITHFNDEYAKEKVQHIENYYGNHRDFYSDLIEKSIAKKHIFTTAGYYKKILRLFPDDESAHQYLSNYKTEIKRRLNKNLELGYSFIKQQEFSKAKRCFKRVITFSPKSEDAKNGLLAIEKEKKKLEKLKRKRAIQSKYAKAKQQLKTEPSSVPLKKLPAELEKTFLSSDEKERIYTTGILAYEGKDFKRAFEIFESIQDDAFKDTSLYIERSQDKIDALGLDED